MKTQAAILVKISQPLEIMEIGIPKLREGQVLVEIKFSGICGTQLAEIDGLKGEDKWLPHCLGHEGIGIIIEKHHSVTKVNIDDIVVLSWIAGNGIEAGGTVYEYQGKNVNAGSVTTFQKIAVVSENRVTKLSGSTIDFSDVLLGCAAPTGMGAIKKVLKASPKKSVAVFGVGGVGLCAILMAKELGLNPIIAIDNSQNRLSNALKCGATKVFNSKSNKDTNLILSCFEGGFDFVVEATGNIQVMAKMMDYLKVKGGKAVIVGNAPYNSSFIISPKDLNSGKSVLGTWGGDSFPDQDFELFSDILVKNRKNLREISKTRFSLSSINTAINSMRNLSAIRPIIDMTLN